jgi:hypothetical protein
MNPQKPNVTNGAGITRAPVAAFYGPTAASALEAAFSAS